MRPAKASLLLTALALTGCAGKPTPVIETKLIDDMPKVENSRQSPCWQQKQIAAQRSYIDTVTTGKQQVYKAVCKDQTPVPLKEKAPPVPVG